MENNKNIGGLYKVNDYVIYRKNGICQIVDIIEQNFCGQGKKQYYVLKSVYDENVKVFVPLNSELEKGLKKVYSIDEIHSLIKESDKVENQWISDGKKRAAMFENIIKSGDTKQILWMIKAIGLYKNELEGQNKKLKAYDTKYLKLGENVVSGEFAFALNIPRSDVVQYMIDYMEKK